MRLDYFLSKQRYDGKRNIWSEQVGRLRLERRIFLENDGIMPLLMAALIAG
jgi:hypothetical protein